MIPGHSKRSGGPKSAQGKLVTSRNAVKSSAYSQVAVLPDEKLEDFKDLLQQLRSDFRVEGAIELAIVNEIAQLIWKKSRLDRLEQNVMVRVFAGPTSAEAIMRHYKGPNDERALSLLGDSELFERDIAAEIQAIKAEAKTCQELINQKALPSVIAENCPQIARLTEEAKLNLQNGGAVKMIFVRGFGRNDDPHEEERDNYARQVANAPKIVASLQWAIDNKAALQAAFTAAKEERLLELMAGPNGRRAHDDLSRSLYRAMAELRRHQEWRLKQAIDISNENHLKDHPL